MDPEVQKKEKGGFSLNKTKVNEFGFNLSSDNKYSSHHQTLRGTRLPLLRRYHQGAPPLRQIPRGLPHQ